MWGLYICMYICMMYSGFSWKEFWIMEKRKTDQIPAFVSFGRENHTDKLSSVLKLNRELLRTVEWGDTKDCAVHGAYASCIVYLRRWNSTMLHLIFWGNNWTSSSQWSYWWYIEINLTIVFNTISSSLQHLVKIVKIPLLTLMCLGFHSWCLVTGKGRRGSPSCPVQRSRGPKRQFVVWLSDRESLTLRLILQTNRLKL